MAQKEQLSLLSVVAQLENAPTEKLLQLRCAGAARIE